MRTSSSFDATFIYGAATLNSRATARKNRDGSVKDVSCEGISVDTRVSRAKTLEAAKPCQANDSPKMTLYTSDFIACGTSCTPAARGECARAGSGTYVCRDGQPGYCRPNIEPTAESCSNLGRDNDCNGVVDDVPYDRASCEVCGNGSCRASETCSSCPQDCGACGQWFELDCLCSNANAANVPVPVRSCLVNANAVGLSCSQVARDVEGKFNVPTTCGALSWRPEGSSETCAPELWNWSYR